MLHVASFLHVLNEIIIPVNFAIKDMIMFIKSTWINKSTLYLSQVVWEANETICKENLCLQPLYWEVWKILKHLVYYCHIFFESNLTIKANTMFTISTMKCRWKNCKLNVIFVNFAMKNLKSSIQNSVTLENQCSWKSFGPVSK